MPTSIGQDTDMRLSSWEYAAHVHYSKYSISALILFGISGIRGVRSAPRARSSVSCSHKYVTRWTLAHLQVCDSRELNRPSDHHLFFHSKTGAHFRFKDKHWLKMVHSPQYILHISTLAVIFNASGMNFYFTANPPDPSQRRTNPPHTRTLYLVDQRTTPCHYVVKSRWHVDTVSPGTYPKSRMWQSIYIIYKIVCDLGWYNINPLVEDKPPTHHSPILREM